MENLPYIISGILLNTITIILLIILIIKNTKKNETSKLIETAQNTQAEIIRRFEETIQITQTEINRQFEDAIQKTQTEIIRQLEEIIRKTQNEISQNSSSETGKVREQIDQKLDRIRDSIMSTLVEINQQQQKSITELSQSNKTNYDTFMQNVNERFQTQEKTINELSQTNTKSFEAFRANTDEKLTQSNESMTRKLTELTSTSSASMDNIRNKVDERLDKIQTELNNSLTNMQSSNEKKLDEMRKTVDEKLEKTLETRLQKSFETVGMQLESVNKGLGEMRTVAESVGSLNKVLSGGKTRGILGEFQLGQILEDILPPQLYQAQAQIIKGSSERVDYAIKLPGNETDSPLYMPIDSKFPLEDYYRLLEGYEKGDTELIETSKRALQRRIRDFGKDIKKKYVSPPETTNFAMIFLPTEGLYSEVVRDAVFLESITREGIIITGPTTLSAMLNSLQIGFKTLQIQKGAADIEKTLGAVKREFGKFGVILDRAYNKVTSAGKDLDSMLSTRTKAINRSLNEIQIYSGDDSMKLLGMNNTDYIPDDETRLLPETSEAEYDPLEDMSILPEIIEADYETLF